MRKEEEVIAIRIRLGYIGVEDTMDRVLAVIRKFPELEAVPFRHDRFEDIPAIVDENTERVDLWLTSGPLVYDVVMQHGDPGVPVHALPYSGASLYRTMCQVFLQHPCEANELSFDIVSENELIELFREVGLDAAALHRADYDGSYRSLIEFHRSLWSDGRTKAAVTCVWYVYHELRRLGVPAYRVAPTEAAIESTLASIVLALETERYKDAQAAVQWIETDPYDRRTDRLQTSDDLNRLEWQLTDKLLHYSNHVHGSLKIISPGRYILFTTRGALREATGNFVRIPDLPELAELRASLTCGIGIGRTMDEAERLGGMALAQSRAHGQGSWMVVFDDKTAKGPLGDPVPLEFGYDTQRFAEAASRSSLSPATLGKIEAVLRLLGTDTINANLLARHLKIVPRSARRILIQLENSGYAEAAGEESPTARGRPIRNYRISLKQGR
ncbi:ArsR family transcriptional regulator [Cohnella fermenti]|uniref:ArsR family transcriptional regulator n=1 Tax=Cohnella fermenti TaxID=2565925 RepID=A0A4S4C879_9BACL|nr:ArsR family transcriptional regulator [Cohnella fermenti]THF84137.1 ArsR family transcriptional regulator [Cohnella fermenti]